MSDEITPPGGTWPEDDPLSFVDDEPPEPRSLLGLPVRLLLALGGFAVPLLAVAWFGGFARLASSSPTLRSDCCIRLRCRTFSAGGSIG